MISRYTRPEMGAVWSEQRKLETWLAVELAVVDALAENGTIPAADAATTPGSAAARPAPAMITRRPRIFAFFAYSATVSGSRWALITRIS